MNNAITTVPAMEKLRYSGLIGEKEKAAITGAVACPVDEITPDRIDQLLTWEGQQGLRRGRNIGPVAMHRIRLWLAFHPNRRAEVSK